MKLLFYGRDNNRCDKLIFKFGGGSNLSKKKS